MPRSMFFPYRRSHLFRGIDLGRKDGDKAGNGRIAKFDTFYKVNIKIIRLYIKTIRPETFS